MLKLVNVVVRRQNLQAEIFTKKLLWDAFSIYCTEIIFRLAFLRIAQRIKKSSYAEYTGILTHYNVRWHDLHDNNEIKRKIPGYSGFHSSTLINANHVSEISLHSVLKPEIVYSRFQNFSLSYSSVFICVHVCLLSSSKVLQIWLATKVFLGTGWRVDMHWTTWD